MVSSSARMTAHKLILCLLYSSALRMNVLHRVPDRKCSPFQLHVLLFIIFLISSLSTVPNQVKKDIYKTVVVVFYCSTDKHKCFCKCWIENQLMERRCGYDTHQEHETWRETLIYTDPDLLPLDYITRTMLQEVTGASNFLFQSP